MCTRIVGMSTIQNRQHITLAMRQHCTRVAHMATMVRSCRIAPNKTRVRRTNGGMSFSVRYYQSCSSSIESSGATASDIIVVYESSASSHTRVRIRDDGGTVDTSARRSVPNRLEPRTVMCTRIVDMSTIQNRQHITLAMRQHCTRIARMVTKVHSCRIAPHNTRVRRTNGDVSFSVR
jgi:hypothetical protein